MQGVMLGEITSAKITRSVSGMGTSGISISCLTFSADGCVYTNNIRAPCVSVSMVNSDGELIDLPIFWVDKRSFKNGVVTFTCYDTLAFADSLYLTEEDFEDTLLKNFGELPAISVLNVIQNKMQVGGRYVGLDNGGMGANCIFKSSALIGQTVSSVLSAIAECSCGYWCISNTNTLKLIRFDGNNCSDIVSTEDYTLPDIGMAIGIEGIDATLDSGKRHSYRADTSDGAGYIISLNTNGTLTEENIDKLGAAVCGDDKYTSWSVEKAFTDHVPDLGARFILRDSLQELVVNNVTAVLDCTGITCSLSANEVSGGEIGQSMGEITRKLENALKSGEVCGDNMMITKYQGIVFLDDENSYGFSSKNGGLTSYEGVMSSAKEASGVTVDKSSGTVTVTYADGHVYKYSANVTETSSGYNITDEKEEWT